MKLMPVLIAHRGLFLGPDSKLENHPDQLLLARSKNYHIEIDLWVIDGKWYLGHDNPQYLITMDWIKNLDLLSTWIHAKNIDALFELRKRCWEGHYFYHQNDDVVLTSTNFLWTYPGKQLTPMSVFVMPEMINAVETAGYEKIYGVCSDYVEIISNYMKKY